jgi:hypothetical protein
MPIKNTEISLKEIFNNLKEKKLVLPNFQRGFVWGRDKQKQFLASILVDLPVGSLLILNGKHDDFAKSELCFPETIDIKHDCEYVLDGQQRLSSLKTIFFDVFDGNYDWSSIFDRLYNPLQNRWFLRIKNHNVEEDIFGITNLKFEKLDKLTDADIVDFIECKRIHKNKTKEIHHPNYGNQKIGLAERTNLISTKYAEEYLVPLYEVYKKDKGIHKKVLQKIAATRIDALKAKAEDSNSPIKYYSDIFSETITKQDIEYKLQNNNCEFTEEWSDLKAKWVQEFSRYLEDLLDKNLPIIKLERSEVNRAVAIFEAINRGGEPLSVYDLIVAKSANNKEIKNLSDHIVEQILNKIELPKELNEFYSKNNTTERKVTWNPESINIIDDKEPSKQFKEWFVNVLSLICNGKNKDKAPKIDFIKKEKILSLTSSDINDYKDRAIQAILKALAFLHLRCGVIEAKGIPYKLMLIVLAYHLDDDDIWDNKEQLKKIEYWYWCSIFGGVYSSRQNEQCIEDINNLKDFLYSNKNEFKKLQDERIFNSQDYLTADILLRKEDGIKESKHAKNSILQYILSKQPYDFNLDNKDDRLCTWKIASMEQSVQIHHIVPLGTVTKIGETAKQLRKDKFHILNSILNLTYISQQANSAIKDNSPTEYLKVISKNSKIENFIPDISSYKDALEKESYAEIMAVRYDYLHRNITSHIDYLIKNLLE